RSSLVDMDALAERLEKDDMYAMLDVFDQEPLEKNSPFRKFKNAYLTPHRAGATLESAYKIVSMCIEDLEAHFAGKRRKYVVTKDMFKRMG
ncbi:MAG: NAD(P)-dependent oxidoreductase, partial [Candidatus Sumerlaeota bacterium]